MSLSLDEGFFGDGRINGLPRDARLMFIGLMTIADHRSGVFPWRPRFILGRVFQDDEDLNESHISDWLELMAVPRYDPRTDKDSALVVRFEARDGSFAFFPRWHKYQKFRWPRDNRYPVPPEDLRPEYAEYFAALDVAMAYDPRKQQQQRRDGVKATPPKRPRGVDAASTRRQRGADNGEAPAATAGAGATAGATAGAGGGGADAPEDQDPPPPPASQDDPAPAAPGDQEEDRLVARLWLRCLETVVPSTQPRAIDDLADRALRALLRRQGRARWAWYVEVLCDLFGAIAADERHRAGGRFAITHPSHLLQRSKPKDPESGLVIEEMHTKFPSKRETPESALERERAAFCVRRYEELADRQRLALRRDRLTPAEQADIRAAVAREWEESRAGPAPPAASSSTSP